jgi:peroxiredoxin
MTLTKSQMLPLETKAPDFNLNDVASGRKFSLSDFKDKKALLVMFICRHCPFVKHVEGEIAKIGKDYKDKDVGIVAISANDAENYPQDSPENLKKQARELSFTFPYLYDEKQEVAKTYTAACTPDFFLFNKDRKLVYRGQIDNARPGKVWVKVDGRDLRGAIDAVLAGRKISEDQKPSIGCNIKWKDGNEPDYFK